MNGTILVPILLLALLQTCVVGEPLSFIFSDTQFFYDMSLYNFYLGRNHIYEYNLTARAGKQVHLYLFQNNEKQYSINAYDGADANANEIEIQPKMIPNNIELEEEPAPISSSGRNMFVRITADNTEPNATVDFQAMATDYVQSTDGCSKVVKTINEVDQYYAFTLNGTGDGCYYVLHANDPTNNPMLAQYLQNGYRKISTNYAIYKGLHTSRNAKLLNSELLSWSWATDKYLLLHLTDSVDLGYYWTFLANLTMNEDVGPYSYGDLMTNDYFQDLYPNLEHGLRQTFELKKYTPVNRIQINFLNFMGMGTVTITSITNNVTSDPTVYEAVDFTGPFNVTYNNCDKIILEYETDYRIWINGSGLYFMYSDDSGPTTPAKAVTQPGILTTTNNIKTIQSSPVTTTRLSTTVSTTTSSPIQSTTNKEMGKKLSAIMVLLICCFVGF